MLSRNLLRWLILIAAPVWVLADENQDRQIEETARTSQTFRRVLDNQIEIKVHDGTATLSGRVPDMDQSRLAEDTIASMDGVKHVDNRIQVDPKRPATDEWLAVKIRSKLLLKPGVSVSHTRVEVKDGVVTLTGTAQSTAQKALTEAAIREVAGVRQVRNHLQIAESAGDVARASRPLAGPDPSLPPGAGLPTGRDPTEAATQDAVVIEDAAITTQVKFELMTNRETSALKTNVDTNEGCVVITGDAETDAQRELVTRLARGVHGVTTVENRMAIKPR